MMIKIALTCSIAAVLIAVPAYADLHECNGMWTNKPCEGEVAAKLKEVTIAEPAKQSTKPEPVKEDLTKEEATAVKPSIRPLINTRSEPKVRFWKDEISSMRWRFSGIVRGHGKTKVKLIYREYSDDDGVNLKRTKVARQRIFKLPDYGEEEHFDWTVRVPATDKYWDWNITAENVTGWKPYHNLSNCCPETKTKDMGRCAADGTVLCNGEKVSKKCRCR